VTAALHPARRVAVLAPMRPELQPLVRPLGLEHAGSGGRDVFRGAAGATEVVAAITGIGPGTAARAAERVLDAERVDHLIVVGIAGGIGPSVAIGDLVVPERVRDLDTGKEHRPIALGEQPPRGILVTATGLLTDLRRIGELERAGAVAIDMETAAIGAVCERRGCPWSVFRAISDRADDGSVDAAVFGLAGSDGAPDAWPVARFLVSHPGHIPRLVRLARGMRAATRAAAAATVRALAAR
jgi:nucleoside phosphorylase